MKLVSKVTLHFVCGHQLGKQTVYYVITYITAPLFIFKWHFWGFRNALSIIVINSVCQLHFAPKGLWLT